MSDWSSDVVSADLRLASSSRACAWAVLRGKRPQHYGCPTPRSAKPQKHHADAGADRNANPGPARPRALRHHSRFQTIPGTDMRQPPTFAALLLALALPALPAAVQAAPRTTVAERSGFVQTGRHADVAELCDRSEA